MGAEPQGPTEFAAVDVTLSTPDWEMNATVAVPVGPTPVAALLPLAQRLSDQVVSFTEQALARQGKSISCKKGCGACCRQLVPISEVEARRIRDLVAGLPEPRRSEIHARFADARRRLSDAGLLNRLLHPEEWTPAAYASLAAHYFQGKLACPFLDEESCSIHPDRPLTCREYLVTSPAENCAQPTPETIDRVRLPLKVVNAVARLNVPPTRPFLESWVPLVLAPEWADAHPDESPLRSGREWLRELFEHLYDKDTADADGQPLSPRGTA